MLMLQRIIIVLVLTTLASCSSINPPSVIQGRDKHYLTAKRGTDLKIPPGLATNGFKNAYPLPDRSYPDYAKTVNITPPGL